jgi:hypothetical protein
MWIYDLVVLAIAVFGWAEIFPFLKYSPGNTLAAIMSGVRYGLHNYVWPIIILFAAANALRNFLFRRGNLPKANVPNSPDPTPVSVTPVAGQPPRQP